MAKTKATPKPTSLFRSALCSIEQGANQATKFHEEGYEIVTTHIANYDDHGIVKQGIYLLARQRGK